MISEFLTAILTIVGCFIVISKYFRKPSNFPPGPLRLPIVGSMPFLKLPIEEGFLELSQKYGPIFGLYIGNYQVVVLTEASVIRQALKSDKFAARPALKPFVDRGMKGIIFTRGEEWKEQRRFALKVLRDFGFGKKSMENLISYEVQELINTMRNDAGKSVRIGQNFNIAVLNALWHILAGERLPHEDPKLSTLLSQFLEIGETKKLEGAFYFMPWFTNLFPNLSGYKQAMVAVQATVKFVHEQVSLHKRTWTKDNPRDFIDVYLTEINSTNDPNSSFYKTVGDESLALSLFDLLTAGADTTSTTLAWIILYAILHPEKQTKLHEEIDRIIGLVEQPLLSHRLRMPYVEAFIAETLRLSSIIPLAVFHAATEDTEFMGYNIPKETIIIPSLWQVHHEKLYWKDPEVFRPERFIDENGLFKYNERLMAFSTGKRVCLGEGLARDELFLFITSIFQNFKLEVDPNQPAEIQRNVGMIAKPKPFKAIIRLRHENNKE